MLAVAIIPSNQDTWHPPKTWPKQFHTYSEAGGCAIIASKALKILFEKYAVNARTFAAKLESQDKDNADLKQTMRDTRAWLEQCAREGDTVCCVHVHTNAGRTPEQGSSHTGYVFSRTMPQSEALGKAIAAETAKVLGLPVVAYDYTHQQYLFDVLFAPLPSVIAEVTRHDRLEDLQALYAQTDAVANALVEGVLAWAGVSPAPPVSPSVESDELVKLRAEVARLRSLHAEMERPLLEALALARAGK